MRYVILITLLAALCGWAGSAAAAEERGLAVLREKLESNLREARSIQADFEQVRKFERLKSELTVRGELAVSADGRMAWYVTAPMRYLCVITPEGVSQWDEDSNTVLTLTQRDLPWLKVLYEGLQSWFRADFKVLERDFVLSRYDERTLKLLPKPGTLYGEAIAEALLSFSEDYRHVERIAMKEKSGDTITITFLNVKINASIPDTTWRLPPVSKKP